MRDFYDKRDPCRPPMFRLATLDDGKITTAIVRQAIPWVSEGAQIFADGDRSLECELMQKRKVYLYEYFFSTRRAGIATLPNPPGWGVTYST
jgi:hypothetical protein